MKSLVLSRIIVKKLDFICKVNVLNYYSLHDILSKGL